MKKKKQLSTSERKIQKIVEERGNLVLEFLAKPSKKRKAELQQKISELDTEYTQLSE